MKRRAEQAGAETRATAGISLRSKIAAEIGALETRRGRRRATTMTPDSTRIPLKIRVRRVTCPPRRHPSVVVASTAAPAPGIRAMLTPPMATMTSPIRAERPEEIHTKMRLAAAAGNRKRAVALARVQMIPLIRPCEMGGRQMLAVVLARLALSGNRPQAVSDTPAAQCLIDTRRSQKTTQTHGQRKRAAAMDGVASRRAQIAAGKRNPLVAAPLSLSRRAQNIRLLMRGAARTTDIATTGSMATRATEQRAAGSKRRALVAHTSAVRRAVQRVMVGA